MSRLILTQKQLDNIQTSIKSANHKRLFVLARYTGQPIKSILALNNKDVYNCFNVPDKNIRFRGYTHKHFDFSVPDALSNLLSEYSPDFYCPDFPLIYSNTDIEKALSYSACDKMLRHYSLVCGYGSLNISFKMIRDSLIAFLIQNGLSDREVQTYLGITSLPILLRKQPMKRLLVTEKVNRLLYS